jgi:GNAT superfamily N-acetyltransferase
MSISFKKYFPAMTVGMVEKQIITSFLYEHLDEYGDTKEDISRCIEYALNIGKHPGGVIITAVDGEKIVGATVINKTGMAGYIPENILVYIAIHKDYRGQGLGRKIMKKAFKETEGDIALHVEPENPARYLYEKLGFTNKYLEMRWKRADWKS